MPARKASEAELSCEEDEVVKVNSKKQKLDSASKFRGTVKGKKSAKKEPKLASKTRTNAKASAKKEPKSASKVKSSAKKQPKSASKKASKKKDEVSEEEMEESDVEMEQESDVQEMESDDHESEASSHNGSEALEPSSASKTKTNDQEQESANVNDEEEPKSASKSKSKASGSASKAKSKSRKKDDNKEEHPDARFIGTPIKKDEAKSRWPDRYSKKKPEETDNGNDKKRKGSANDEDECPAAACAAHYSKAEVDGTAFELGDCVHVNSGEGDDYIGKIVEFFEDVKKEKWFTAQWFFRLQDTAVKDVELSKHDSKRVFISNVKDLNPLDCLVSKVKIIKLTPQHHFNIMKPKPLPPCDYYYDMSYDYGFSRFCVLPPDAEGASSESDITNCNEASQGQASSSQSELKGDAEVSSCDQKEYALLDLYSGCGGMSTGLCMGAALSSTRLVTKWSLDLNPNACTSLQYNHPETNVRNESADDFLELLKEWKKLCEKYAPDESVEESKTSPRGKKGSKATSKETKAEESEPGEYEVEKIMGIRHVGASGEIKAQLEYNVRWKGYGPSEDTWEPADGLSSCEDSIREFVRNGRRNNILPMPGDVDVICGGPPCQGASGFNRFRNKENPLADARNKQIIVYMDIVNFLKPRFVLMENVVDILKFADGLLGRYALYRMVQMHYQVQLGMMVAGCYGLPQFRMRVFVWGAAPNEKLPAYPLPTHDVIPKGGIPQEWERNMVAHSSGERPSLHKALTLGDALRDLPPVKNSESRDEMNYEGGAKTEFQRFIRLPKEVLTGTASLASFKKQKFMLNDHRPLTLNNDDYQRVCKIPHRKGANFRCLPGVIVREDNTVALDPNMERVMLPSGKPLVPDYAITFVKGKSPKPFGRLWWDETVPTVVTRAEPHNQIILHPEQDRVLTIRENARLQGFPDCYKLFGPVKQRYIQVGNAVAVPVGRVLGYSLGLAFKQMAPPTPTMLLPAKFPQSLMKSALNDIPLEPMDVQESS